MKLAFVLYEDMTALDLVGPYEVLSSWPGAEVCFVASTPGPKRADQGLILSPTHTLDELSDPDIIVVGGSSKAEQPIQDEALLNWFRAASPQAKWTTSVCTGAGILAAAGLLEGRKATTHWGYRERLAELGAEPISDRVHVDAPFITAAGVSAGIDMALTLTGLELGDDIARAIQLGIEYDPQPPFDAGSPEKAGPELTEFVRNYSAASIG